MANTDVLTNAVRITQAGRLYYSLRLMSTVYAYPNTVTPLDPAIYYKTYEEEGSTVRLTVPVSDVLDFILQQAGTLKTIRIFGNSGTGTTTFNVRLNGAPLFAGGGRPVINTGESSETIDGLSNAVAVGDVLSLDIDVITGTGLFPKFTFAAITQA